MFILGLCPHNSNWQLRVLKDGDKMTKILLNSSAIPQMSLATGALKGWWDSNEIQGTAGSFYGSIQWPLGPRASPASGHQPASSL